MGLFSMDSIDNCWSSFRYHLERKSREAAETGRLWAVECHISLSNEEIQADALQGTDSVYSGVVGIY